MRTAATLLALLLGGASIKAQSTTSPPVGFTTGTCLGASDTLLSLPFNRPAEFVGAIAAVSGTTLTVSGSTGWQANQFVYGDILTSGSTQHNHYYALIGPRQIALSGSINLTSGTNAVTGVGTSFTSAIAPGDGLILTGSTGSGYYSVQAVTDDTDLTLTGAARATLAAQPAAVSKSPKEGSTYLVTANATDGNGVSTLVLDTNGDDISPVAAGTQVSLIPYWTLNTVFPATDANVWYTPSTSTHSGGVQTEILIPGYAQQGVNLTASAFYYYYGGAWREVGFSEDHGDDVFLPDGYFTVRNPTAQTQLTVTGAVNMQRLSIPLVTGTSPTTQQDNFVSITRPLPVTLNDLNLIGGGAFTPSVGTHSGSVYDQLLLFDNTTAAINKTAAAFYYYYAGAWRQEGYSGDHGGDVIPAGAAILIRKYGAASATTQNWSNPPTY